MPADTTLADADYPKPRASLPGFGATGLRIAHPRRPLLGARACAPTTLMLAENHEPQAPFDL